MNIPVYSGIIALLWTLLNISLLAIDIREDRAWARKTSLNEARAYLNRDQDLQFWTSSTRKTVTHVFIWIIGMGGITLWAMQVKKNFRRQRHDENLLVKSEDKYRSIFENSIEGIYQTTVGGRFITVNPALARMFGFDSPADMMECTSDIGHQIYVDPEAREGLKKILFEKGRAEGYEAEVYRKDGSRIWIIMNSRAVSDSNGSAWYIEGNAVDITERKQAELALKESEERYRLLYNSTPVMLHSIDRDGRLLSVSDHWLSAMGYTREEVIGRLSTEFLTEDSRVYAREEVLPAFYKSGTCTDVPYQFVTKTGGIIDVNLSAVAEKDAAGNVTRSLAVLVDVTERNKAEEELRIKSLAIESSIDAMAISDLDGSITYANPSFLRFWGFSDVKEVIGTAAKQYREKPHNTSEIIKTLYSEGGWHGEVTAIKKDGARFLVEVSLNLVYGKKGKPVGLLGSFLDITERKRTEEALLENEKRFRTIIEVTGAGYFRIGRDGLFQFVNAAWLSMHGYSSPDEVIGKHVAITQVDIDMVSAQGMVDDFLNGTLTPVGESSRKNRDGSIGYQSYTVNPVIHGGTITGLEGFLIDITEHKKTMDALKISEERFRSLFDTMTEGVAIHRLVYNYKGKPVDYIIMDSNPAFETHTGLDRSKVAGRKATDVYGTATPPNFDVYVQVASTGKPVRFDTYFEPLKKHFSISAFSPARGFFATVFEDITEHRIAEEKITASLREKELLLKEIHHRVKNNMQIIISLLRMKAEKVRDPEIARHFQDSQNRIFSMALIHERLYQTQDFARIDLNSYAHSLIQELFCMYDVEPHKIRFTLDIQDIPMGIDQAIPFGLVINELVTNSIKYAFPPDKTGEGMISISMSMQNGSIETIISDNGIGILESVDYKSTGSSGLTLVHMIIEKQLQGTIRLSRDKGTTYSISIPADDKTARNK